MLLNSDCIASLTFPLTAGVLTGRSTCPLCGALIELGYGGRIPSHPPFHQPRLGKPSTVETQGDYEELLQRIARAYSQIEILRLEPPSPKRDHALALLGEAHAQALMTLRESTERRLGAS
jgi:hypothetical protein